MQNRYRSGIVDGMSIQIAVRLPNDLVEFVDEVVRHGDAPSRAAVVARALRRERRQTAAARDAAILARTEPDADLNSLAEHAAALPIDDLD
jgi:Arc/MetJ-type ribon-helix-helix transcriptional regulator